MTYQEQTEQFIKDSLEKGKSNEEIQKYLLSDFMKWARVTKVVFMYQYCNNEENRLRGRVGMNSGWRVGTIASTLIPKNRHPRNRKPTDHLNRYYDLGRMSFRSHHKDRFIILSLFQNPKTGEFVETPQEAQITRLKAKTNFKWQNTPDTEEEVQRRAKIQLKIDKSREEQIERQRIKESLQKGLIEDRVKFNIQDQFLLS